MTWASIPPACGRWRDEDGYFWITGRIGDVTNVSGHRLSASEIESALGAPLRWRRPLS